ncbi:flagellar basal body-associated FliL family protein [Desulfuromonas acetoxidans]|uniref:Flagellar protein FliL n=1 Tax=Desulfuromonas acetoxidans (strain DSM 684 / 11070) TaxID=281689 RepID=Q1JZS8_DESA6|nr:flagellar basal body-associated FliL family protein [Desulfuromonas acetoxidans]EAT15814.1 flagellar basal body-associated protein FliL [Desulfuromonas acetoxidans DSM 684]
MLIAVGIAAYLLGSRSAQQAPAGESAEVEDTSKAEGVGPMVDITDFIINILDKNETRYLKAAITLELENEETVVEVNERMPQIRDSILLLIGNKTFAELNDLQGKLQLRAEIIVRLNKLLKKGKVKGIYFTEFVVQ